MAKLGELLANYSRSWELYSWDEIDWFARIKEVQLREILELRKAAVAICQGSECLACPNFVKHVGFRGR